MKKSEKKKNWRRIYQALEKPSWEFLGVSENGAPFAIEGVDVWPLKWDAGRSHSRVHVRNPHDGEIIEVGVYAIKSGARRVRFAVGAFSESVFGFYAPKQKRPNKAPEPTPGAGTPRATEGGSK